MTARSDAQEMNATAGARRPRSRAWRYAPLAAWTALILLLSTGVGGAAHTSLIVEPVVRWLFPHTSEERVRLVHFAVRKVGHFTGYGALALFAARAFLPSPKEFLRRHWFAASLAYVVCVSLLDEFNQSFNPARTGTIRDSVLDAFGALTALAALAYLRARRGRRAVNFRP
ncbi:MAG: VanZ family protein [Acidobacteria bacterium]|nr:VanZ family protein [Acidobacteriota bacterium]